MNDTTQHIVVLQQDRTNLQWNAKSDTLSNVWPLLGRYLFDKGSNVFVNFAMALHKCHGIELRFKVIVENNNIIACFYVDDDPAAGFGKFFENI